MSDADADPVGEFDQPRIILSVVERLSEHPIALQERPVAELSALVHRSRPDPFGRVRVQHRLPPQPEHASLPEY